MTVLRLLALVLALAVLPAHAAIVDFDTSFASAGTAKHNLGFDHEDVNSVYVAPSGLIYVLARAYDIENGGVANDHVVILRLKGGGQLDGSFGSGGKILIPEATLSATSFVPYSIFADEAGGRLYLPGAHIGVMNGNSSRLGVARLEFNGDYDDTFGNGGVAYIDAPTTSGTYSYDNIANHVARLADGSIVAIGIRSKIDTGSKVAMARFSSTGAPDTSFGGAGSTNGFLVLDFGQAREYGRSVTPAPDGSLVIAASSGDDFTQDLIVGRMTTAGAFVPAFSTVGWRTDDLGGSLFNVMPPYVAADGKITLAGSSSVGGDLHNFVARYTSTGDRDNSFDGDGLYDEPVTTFILNGPGALHPSGRIVFGESVYSDATKYDLAIRKLVGHEALAVPGFVDTSGGGGGGGGGALGAVGLALLGLAGLARGRKR